MLHKYYFNPVKAMDHVVIWFNVITVVTFKNE